ncbi:hypothetical protein PV325_006637 [Microctonus aethiopoides]|nr:hypothetical protein PV325_006637 [Microctonus aethiopoides]KAK0096715.1 hypothetical protein PV326_004661 [Microctonus aethiopoides]
MTVLYDDNRDTPTRDHLVNSGFQKLLRKGLNVLLLNRIPTGSQFDGGGKGVCRINERERILDISILYSHEVVPPMERSSSNVFTQGTAETEPSAGVEVRFVTL